MTRRPTTDPIRCARAERGSCRHAITDPPRSPAPATLRFLPALVPRRLSKKVHEVGQRFGGHAGIVRAESGRAMFQSFLALVTTDGPLVRWRPTNRGEKMFHIRRGIQVHPYRARPTLWSYDDREFGLFCERVNASLTLVQANGDTVNRGLPEDRRKRLNVCRDAKHHGMFGRV